MTDDIEQLSSETGLELTFIKSMIKESINDSHLKDGLEKFCKTKLDKDLVRSVWINHQSSNASSGRLSSYS
jgi:hypothetical protein